MDEAFVFTLESDPPETNGSRLVIQLLVSAKSELLGSFPGLGGGQTDEWAAVRVGDPVFRVKDVSSLNNSVERNLEVHVFVLTADGDGSKGPLVGFLRDQQTGRWVLPKTRN